MNARPHQPRSSAFPATDRDGAWLLEAGKELLRNWLLPSAYDPVGADDHTVHRHRHAGPFFQGCAGGGGVGQYDFLLLLAAGQRPGPGGFADHRAYSRLSRRRRQAARPARGAGRHPHGPVVGGAGVRATPDPACCYCTRRPRCCFCTRNPRVGVGSLARLHVVAAKHALPFRPGIFPVVRSFATALYAGGAAFDR